MSPIAIALDLLLAGLMLVALVVGGRLNRRLKALRDSHASFAQSVAELNEAASRAEAGLASLRAASEEAHDALLARIETARGLIVKLDTANQRAEHAAAPSPRLESQIGDAKAPSVAHRRTLANLAATASQPIDVPPAPVFASPPRSSKPPVRPLFDDELFESQAESPQSGAQDTSSPTVRAEAGYPKGDRQ